MKNLKKIKNLEAEGNPVYRVIGTKFLIARSSTAYINEVYVYETDEPNNDLIEPSNMNFSWTSCRNLKETAEGILEKLQNEALQGP